jgi:hypothetical protein
VSGTNAYRSTRIGNSDSSASIGRFEVLVVWFAMPSMPSFVARAPLPPAYTS